MAVPALALVVRHAQGLPSVPLSLQGPEHEEHEAKRAYAGSPARVALGGPLSPLDRLPSGQLQGEQNPLPGVVIPMNTVEDPFDTQTWVLCDLWVGVLLGRAISSLVGQGLFSELHKHLPCLGHGQVSSPRASESGAAGQTSILLSPGLNAYRAHVLHVLNEFGY